MLFIFLISLEFNGTQAILDNLVRDIIFRSAHLRFLSHKKHVGAVRVRVVRGFQYMVGGMDCRDKVVVDCFLEISYTVLGHGKWVRGQEGWSVARRRTAMRF
ncbi:hypothetical protein K504DRAFT_252094 [Pleomassaria siparia CBS 279.74]|uniref:Uncharacterized protein n=1 Tax=Pleomassaria siparia CBS 279.74 TaxID=1314801 RepID=A0A6G1KBI1_9PLEO|nr:hypothetical protein K504DRAFT_252094 [Pleomassaria siparia CBS 279.74]